MKLPKNIKTYCPNCDKHRQHIVSRDKSGKEGTMKRGRRRFEEVKKGYKGSPRTPKKDIYKIGKRNVIILKCKECKKKHQRVYRSRSKSKPTIK